MFNFSSSNSKWDWPDFTLPDFRYRSWQWSISIAFQSRFRFQISRFRSISSRRASILNSMTFSFLDSLRLKWRALRHQGSFGPVAQECGNAKGEGMPLEYYLWNKMQCLLGLGTGCDSAVVIIRAFRPIGGCPRARPFAEGKIPDVQFSLFARSAVSQIHSRWMPFSLNSAVFDGRNSTDDPEPKPVIFTVISPRDCSWPVSK